MMNRAKFLQNGKCGYILKPEFMFTNESYNLGEETEDKKVIKIQISRNSLFVEFPSIFFPRYIFKPTDRQLNSPTFPKEKRFISITRSDRRRKYNF